MRIQPSVKRKWPFPLHQRDKERPYQGDSAFYRAMQRKKTPNREAGADISRIVVGSREGVDALYPIAGYRVLGEN